MTGQASACTAKPTKPYQKTSLSPPQQLTSLPENQPVYRKTTLPYRKTTLPYTGKPRCPTGKPPCFTGQTTVHCHRKTTHLPPENQPLFYRKNQPIQRPHPPENQPVFAKTRERCLQNQRSDYRKTTLSPSGKPPTISDVPLQPMSIPRNPPENR